ncbi:LysM peptidoglycan-binding domain-containing protein [Halovulum dunhuangense]|uniref:LysM peptidoglycan-binding domain-containing protein n=1 Tax=Halovulum dunhuangense TaxID=1505036 RepID=A0A849L3S7_9RHOB|nr:LysM peptidoglycan-binding domain-containing protein [Halovulum dunhuangense]NNU80852.1 LysM peptidoglycan-binding domain-containing protein [Halovulum dunhuangense]
MRIRSCHFIAPLAAVTALGLAHTAAALAVADPAPLRIAAGPGVEVAQLETVTDESARRRIGFYADRVLKSLSELAEDDRAAAETGAATDEQTLVRLRENVARFVEAAEAGGLSNEQAGEVLTLAYNERYEGLPPTPLLAASGGLDGAGIVANYGTRREAPAQQVDYLAAISAAGAETREERLARLQREEQEEVQAVESASAPPVAEVEVEVAAEPEVPLDPETAAMLARLSGNGANRTITIAPGDTLGRIASALYGDALLYRRIYDANRDVLRDPDTLRIGLVLVVPE